MNFNYAVAPNNAVLFQHTMAKDHEKKEPDQAPAQIQASGYDDVLDSTSSTGATKNEDLPIEELGKSLLSGSENFPSPRKYLDVNVSAPSPSASIALPVKNHDLPAQIVVQSQWSYALPKSNFSLYLPYAIVLMLYTAVWMLHIAWFCKIWSQSQKKIVPCLV